MDKKVGLLWLAGILLFCGCRTGRMGAIPELSPHQALNEAPNVTLASLPTFFFSRGKSIGTVQSDGRIFLFSIDPLNLLAAESLPFPPAAGTHVQDDLILMHNRAAGKIVVYDLAQQKVIGEWNDRGNETILSFSREYRLYRMGGEILLERISGGEKLLRLPADRYPAECIFFGHGLVYGNSEKSFFSFSAASARFKEYPLPEPADTMGLLSGDRFYYGTKQRQLICFSPTKRKGVWKIRLPDQLAFPPFTFRSYIVAVTRGGALLFLNRRGSLVWWLGLPSYASFFPVCLKEHMAFVLENNELCLVNVPGRRVTRFPLSGRPDGAPFLAGGYLFMTGTRADGIKKVMRFGNRIEVEISQNPEMPMVGRSVVFRFAVFNLPAARLALRLEDAAGNSVLEKNITAFQPFSLAWIPLRGGRYTLKIRADAGNMTRESSRSFQVVDWREWVDQFVHFRIGLI